MKTSFFSCFFTLTLGFFVVGAWAEVIQAADNIGKNIITPPPQIMV